MKRLLGVADVSNRYQCCQKTARRIIQSVDHIVYPHLMAFEDGLLAWEQQRTVMPGRTIKIDNMASNDYRIPKRK